MGLLSVAGLPMKWGSDRNNNAVRHVTTHGIQQFLWSYKSSHTKHDFPFLWGEEVEHQLVRIEENTVKLSLNATEVIKSLEKVSVDGRAEWHPEYGSFMIESLPGKPYTAKVDSLCSVEANIRQRYQMLDDHAGENTIAVTLVTFPLMGVGQFSTSSSTEAPYSHSLFVPDVCINDSHPRFKTLTQNIRLRRGRKVCIQVPMFIDSFTLQNTVDPLTNIDRNAKNAEIVCHVTDKHASTNVVKYERADEAPECTTDPISVLKGMTHLYTPSTYYYYAQYFKKDRAERVKQRYDTCPCPIPSVSHPCIYMDCMAFGMGCNCLQLTMQLSNETQARHIYDQLAILCPIFLALSSATPFQKGILCDSDVRWLTISAAVDDRKGEEVPRIIKSRYDSISTYVSSVTPNLEEFNDEEFLINNECYEVLTEAGVDSRLATHIAHLFIRDPLVIYDQLVEIDDHMHMDHFENIQSTNWQSVRLKPPTLDGAMGWRVEFRVMDVMPTPFENAAYSVFIILLTQVIIKYDLMFYTKLSIVDENMGHAHNRDPCNERYTMRRDVFARNISTDPSENGMFTINEIFNGKSGEYVGLIPLVRRYLQEEDVHSELLNSYLSFISRRAAGEVPTAAQYLRNCVLRHPDYKRDSRITEQIALDIVRHVHDLACGNDVERYFSAHSVATDMVPSG
ncbi:putative gamma-glutamylcysteine synthetase [Trypanosoma vivax]|nr:putative gamma-glutamylcysteine synthetase [Trypanosoma vivax]